jgi:uncharacterized membrane protein
MANRAGTAALVLLAVAYPFLGAFLIRAGWSGAVLAAFAVLTAGRACRAGRPALRIGYGALAAALLLGAAFAAEFAARLIPSFVHLSLAALFGHTLANPPSLIERMVRLQFPEFEPGIAEYLRQLTRLWTALFLANAAVCGLLAALASERVWMLYTGGLVYLPMAGLAVGEYLYRPRRFPGLAIPAPLDSVRAMLRNGRAVFRELR